MTAGSALTIGNFDGVHLGHAELIREARRAVGDDGQVEVLAFDPHPRTVLRPQSGPLPISTFAQRCRWLTELGADRVELLDPTGGVLEEQPEAFIAGVVARHRPTVIVEGPDFRFGSGRAGTVGTLRSIGERHGFRTVIIDPVDATLCDHSVVRASSSAIRWLVARGRVSDAARLLGRDHEIEATIVPGDRRGRELGVPTANLDGGDERATPLLPADGIYSGRALGPDGAWHPAAISVGAKPTFGSRPRVCEVHLIGFEGPLDQYGWPICVRFGRWIRDQVAFDGVEALVDQIRRDVERAAADERSGGELGSAGRTTTATDHRLPMSYVSNATMSEIAARVAAAQRVMITTHTKPDGDALGSALALTRALIARERQADIYVAGPIEPCLRSVAGATPFHDLADDLPGEDHDLAIVLDTGAWSQLVPISDWLRAHGDLVLGLDHHARGDDVASLRVVDPSLASTAQLVAALLDELGWPITPGPDGEAEPLFVALATDTGWFKYPNADAAAFALGARLLKTGVDNAALYEVIEQTHRPQRLSLEARALSSLEYARDGAVAVMVLRQEDFRLTGGSLEDLTGIVNLPMVVGSVRVAILLVEVGPTLAKISFRSKPAPSHAAADDFVDVNVLAHRFGGGGHVHAAGARCERSIDDAKASVMELLEH